MKVLTLRAYTVLAVAGTRDTQVTGADHQHAAVLDLLAVDREFAVTTRGGRQIDQHRTRPHAPDHGRPSPAGEPAGRERRRW